MYFFAHSVQVFNRAIEDVRRQVDTGSPNKPERLRPSANNTATESLMEENRSLQKRLSNMERDNSNLKADLRKAKEDVKRKDKIIGNLRYELSGVQKTYDEDLVAWRELYQEHQRAKEDLKKKDEDIVSLQQKLQAQLEEAEQMRASMNESSERWQEEVCHLKELLTEKEEQINEAHEKDELHESALKQLQDKCVALQVELHQHLTGSEESRQRTKKENVQKLSEQKQELEETLRVKLKIREDKEAKLKEHLHLVMTENIQLQVCYLCLSQFYSCLIITSFTVPHSYGEC